jgi:hypothetical protein
MTVFFEICGYPMSEEESTFVGSCTENTALQYECIADCYYDLGGCAALEEADGLLDCAQGCFDDR